MSRANKCCAIHTKVKFPAKKYNNMRIRTFGAKYPSWFCLSGQCGYVLCGLVRLATRPERVKFFVLYKWMQFAIYGVWVLRTRVTESTYQMQLFRNDRTDSMGLLAGRRRNPQTRKIMQSHLQNISSAESRASPWRVHLDFVNSSKRHVHAPLAGDELFLSRT